jgi:methylglutaconyl-CoA hydratase
MEHPTILVNELDGVRTITLNRPERRNALTPEMMEELIAALEDAGKARSCRVVVLRGAGAAFCGGLDLAYLQAMEGRPEEELEADARRIARMLRTLYELPKPTIAVVQGAAIAGGAGLATICDLTLAAKGARFGYTEVRIGFVPAVVSAHLVLQVGDQRARELLVTGRLFDGVEAQRLGLVSEVMAEEDLEGRADALARLLMENSPASMRATKALLAEQNRAWLDAATEAALAANAKSRETADFREGVAAFLEKRRPHWGE